MMKTVFFPVAIVSDKVQGSQPSEEQHSPWITTRTMQQQQDNNDCMHTIAVVAKCPIPGKSKTRLIPLLGEDGSALLAKAMLSDVLCTLSECQGLKQVRKILFYAPAEEAGLGIMKALLSELGLTEASTATEEGWRLLPMTSSTDMTATHLGAILTDILQRTRAPPACPGKVLFLGMDSPELPLEEIMGSLLATSMDTAVLCPANDGGYGLLAVPPQATGVFSGIRWSDPLTALGQLKALTDNNIPVKLGRLMNDIDEPSDVHSLCQRLSESDESKADEDDILLKSSSGKAQETGPCRHTRQVLKLLGQL